jgi:hypothetical protein
MDHTKKKTEGFDKAAGRAFKAIGVGAVIGLGIAGKSLIDLGKQAVTAASDSEQSMGATESVFKQYAGTVIKTSKTAAKEYGISANTYRENANILGSLFKNQGVSVDQLAGKTKGMIGTASDLAATFGGTTTEAVEALSSAFKGEFDPIEKYGISLKQSTVNTEAMRVAHVKTTAAFGKLSDAQQTAAKSTAAANIIARQSKDAQGGFARETDTYAHKVQVLSAAWEDAKAELGKALIPTLAKVAGYLGDRLPKAIEDFKAGWHGVGVGKSEISSLADSLHNLSESLSGITKQTKGSSNGFISFAKGGIRALTSISDGFAMLGANWKLVSTRIEQWNTGIMLSWAKTVNRIQRIGAGLPGPIGRHFKRLADQGQAQINRLQAKMNSANTRNAQAQVNALDIKIRHLKGKTVKTQADRAALARSISQVRTLIAKNAALRSKSITISTRFVTTGRRTAPSEMMAEGGRVSAGSSYIVGDGGREELFVPDVPGTILPRVPPQSSPRPYGGGGGGTTIHVHIQGSVLSTQRELRDAVNAAMKAAPAGTGGRRT